jgi:hypothetical protein
MHHQKKKGAKKVEKCRKNEKKKERWRKDALGGNCQTTGRG